MSEGLDVSLAELGERIEQELAITDWRAIIMVVVVAPGLEHEVERVILNQPIAPTQLLEVVVRRDEVGREQLRAFNRARDSLLAEKRLIVLRASSQPSNRLARPGNENQRGR